MAFAIVQSILLVVKVHHALFPCTGAAWLSPSNHDQQLKYPLVDKGCLKLKSRFI